MIELIVNGRGDANVAADTKFGASDEMAVRPAAIHCPRPRNIANCGTHERSVLPRASKIEASTDSTIASHNAHPTASRTRRAIGATSVGVSRRSK